MLGRICARIVTFFNRKKISFYLLLLLFVCIGLFGISRIKINANIFDIFPDGEGYKQFSEIMKENDFTKQVVFSINVQPAHDSTIALIDECIKEFEKRGNYFHKFVVSRDVDQQELIQYLQHASLAELDSADYLYLQHKWSDKAAIEKQLDYIKAQLQGPKALFYATYFAQDPLGVFSEKMTAYSQEANASNYLVEDGLLLNKEATKVFFFATLNCNQTAENCSNEASDVLGEVCASINKRYKQANLEGFGTFLIAVENEKQIRKDTTLTLIISVTLIFAILFFYYRKISIPLVFMIPSVFGVLFGLGFVGFYHPNINIISIVTASVLLGIVLDYSFHFFTHLKHTKSIIETVKDVSFPMLVGSFTTIGAFASLLFTNSTILQDFGLIALVTLMGAALFTIIGLPVILDSFKFEFETESKEEKRMPKWVPKLVTLLIVIGTVYFLFQNQSMRFDGDLNNLAYHPKHLVDSEKTFTGVNPTEQKKIYLFSKGESRANTETVNGDLYKFIASEKKKYDISEVISVAPYLLAKNRWEEKQQEWRLFWEKNPKIIEDLNRATEEKGFNKLAFSPFLSIVEDTFSIRDEGLDLVHQLGIEFLIHENQQSSNILTSVLINRSDVDAFKKEVKSQFSDTVFIMDISDLSAQFLTSLTADFNYLLLFSSLLVFISLLVIYGRLELSLFAFAPMAISWLWIISCGAIFGMEFNFVNILLVTFIFGLGDDYSIFVTDGLINQSRTGAKSLSSYKQAIILSGITTIIGTGVLVFGKHPAINSIGGLSVLGIGLILIVTLIVQPYIFGILVTKRKEKGRGPITILTLVSSISLFTTFFICCLLSLVFLLLLMVLPFSKKKKQYWLNYGIYLVAKMFMTCYPFVKVRYLNRSLFDTSKARIIVANHNSFLDILAVLSISPKVIILVKDWVYKSPIFGPCIRFAGYLYVEDGTEKNRDLVRQRINAGYNIVIFPEGTRSENGQINRFHKGAFLLAKNVQVEIQPLILVGFNAVNPKNDVMINGGELLIKFLPSQHPDHFESYQAMTKSIQQLMRQELANSLIVDTNDTFWKYSILRNYLLKGPILEWYVRVKYRLEGKNFVNYNQLIGKRTKIYDIGCGLGYLDFLLHYANVERTITALDSDEEKIAIASNGIYDNNQLHFEVADISNYNYESADVFIINDVLHYLPMQVQDQLLTIWIKKLNAGGLLIIRDGITEHQKVNKTKWTEILSTKVFGFNKGHNEMEFVSRKKMEELASRNNLQLTQDAHSNTTSNHLFVFQKK